MNLDFRMIGSLASEWISGSMEYWSDGVMILKRRTAALHRSINPKSIFAEFS